MPPTPETEPPLYRYTWAELGEQNAYIFFVPPPAPGAVDTVYESDHLMYQKIYLLFLLPVNHFSIFSNYYIKFTLYKLLVWLLSSVYALIAMLNNGKY